MIIPLKYNLRKTAAPFLALILFAFALFLLHKLLQQYHVNEIRAAFHAISRSTCAGVVGRGGEIPLIDITSVYT